MFQIVFLRWTCDLLYSRGAPASRDRMNNTSDRALTRQLTWLPSAAREAKLTFLDHSPQKRRLPAHSWDVQLRGGTDAQGQTGGSWNSTCRTGATFLLPHPPTSWQTTSWLIWLKENSLSYLIFGKPPGDHNFVLRKRLSLPLLGTLACVRTHPDTHSHTHTQLYTMVVQAAVAPNRSQRLLLKIPYGSLRRRSVERVSDVAGCLSSPSSCSEEREMFDFIVLYIASFC